MCCLNIRVAGTLIGCLSILISSSLIILAINNRCGKLTVCLLTEYVSVKIDDFKSVLMINNLCIGLGALDIITSIFVVLGTMMELDLMLYPWAVQCPFTLAVNLPMFLFYLMCFMPSNKDESICTLYEIPIIMASILFGLYICMWITICKLCKTLRSSTQETTVGYDDSKSTINHLSYFTV